MVQENERVREQTRRKVKPLIKVVCVDRNVGDRQHKNVRSRLVAKKSTLARNKLFLEKKPPLEALRMLLNKGLS